MPRCTASLFVGLTWSLGFRRRIPWQFSCITFEALEAKLSSGSPCLHLECPCKFQIAKSTRKEREIFLSLPCKSNYLVSSNSFRIPYFGLDDRIAVPEY
ncbi:hypothetical protein BT96DRAFT_365068 [Gymnopus androsaceus JB14]|uniref:Uncharacterized protein n=1 Tax=Gymnopus androsaceus JB14 TaxID=1447944 RepID=A0A6A4GVK9_9AGAR|nr:hypothetical protein BT96DRAFT_365068 [Gymnopus androsaceus JB14]